jgi:capsular polysaccharide transport system permease protein
MSDKQKRKKKPQTAAEVRRARARSLVLRFAIWCGIPTLVAVVYYGFVATPQYESRTTFAIQSSRDRPSFGGLGAILGVPMSSGRDAQMVVSYIHSRDMMKLLDEKLGILAHFKSKDADRFSRLDDDADSEETYEYYKHHIGAVVSDKTAAIVLHVRAFKAEVARDIARAIIKASEDRVNRITERARKDHLKIAERAVAQTEKRLKAARAKIFELQGDHSVLDPRVTVKSVSTLAGQLEAEIITERAKLSSLMAVLRKDAPKVIAARKRLGSLQYELKRQRAKLVGKGSKSMKSSIAELEPALVEKEFAEKAYIAAMKGLELARLEASRQVRYVVTLSEPSLPSAATHPRRLWKIATVFAVSLLLMGVVSLLIASVREHGKF